MSFFCIEYFENIKTIKTISEPLYFYVTRQDSALHRYNEKRVSECISYIECYQLLSEKYNVDLKIHDLVTYYLHMWFGLINNESNAPDFWLGMNNVKKFVQYPFFKENLSKVMFSKLTKKMKIYYILVRLHFSNLVYLVLKLKKKIS